MAQFTATITFLLDGSWAVLRKITREDFTWSEWSVNYSNGQLYAYRTATPIRPFLDEMISWKETMYSLWDNLFHHYDDLSGWGASRAFRSLCIAHYSGESCEDEAKKVADVYWRCTAPLRKLSLKGVQKDRQQAKIDKAIQTFKEELQHGTEAEDTFLTFLQQRFERRCDEERKRVLKSTVESATSSYKPYGGKEKMVADAGVKHLQDQIDVLSAQLKGLQKERDRKLTDFVVKVAEKYDPCPDELRQAILEKLKKSGFGPHSRRWGTP